MAVPPGRVINRAWWPGRRRQDLRSVFVSQISPSIEERQCPGVGNERKGVGVGSKGEGKEGWEVGVVYVNGVFPARGGDAGHGYANRIPIPNCWAAADLRSPPQTCDHRQSDKFSSSRVLGCGFAQSQEAYDKAVNALFDTLDILESHLGTHRYLCGDVLTLADVCLFTTLIRFDLVYYVLFKCTKRKLVEYPNLHGYTRDIYQIPKVAETCNFEAIMDGYFRTLFPLNPGSIRPVIPFACEPDVLSKPHGRDSICSNGKRLELKQKSNVT